MRGGFLLGSVVLIGMYVLYQPGVSGRVSDASNIFVAITRRLLSPDAAGIGNHAAGTAGGSGGKATLRDKPTAGSGSSGGQTPRYTGYFQA